MAKDIDPIYSLLELKKDIDKLAIKDKRELAKKYNYIQDLVWENIANEYIADLSDVYRLNSYLIEEVINIHNREKSDINKRLLESNINIRDIKDSLEDSKSACKIYMFNDPKQKYYIIGDIHSDNFILNKILEKIKFFKKIYCNENFKIIFLGDYVDRGKNHLKTLQNILTLKYLFPNNIILLRGNHDGGEYSNNKVRMPVRKPENSKSRDWFLLYLQDITRHNISLPKDIITEYLKFFDSLNYIGFIFKEDKYFMLSHGGIPRYNKIDENYYGHIKSLDDLTNEHIIDEIGNKITHNIVWSDPLEKNESDYNLLKGRFKFDINHYTEFKKIIGFDYFIRGHQVKEDGVAYSLDNTFITIFSSGKFMLDNKNINKDTAYKKVNPKILCIDGESINIISIN